MHDHDATNPAAGDDLRADDLGVVEAAGDGDDFELDDGEDGEDDGPPPAEAPPADELEDVEFDGRRFRVPTALKSALMMHADYTRKTQEVAAHRQDLEQRADALAQQAEAMEASFHDRARLVLIDQTLAGYDDLDWEAWEAEDPQGSQALLRQHIQLKEARAELADRLRRDEDEQVLSQQRTRAMLAQEGHAVLSREIPGWGADLQAKLAQAAQEEFGFTAGELSQVLDPRLTTSCAASTQISAPPPRLQIPPAALEPCDLYRLPEHPTIMDLEMGYATRGAQILECEGRRKLAVDTAKAEHELEIAWERRRRTWRCFWTVQ